MQVTVTNNQFTGCSKMYCVTQSLYIAITMPTPENRTVSVDISSAPMPCRAPLFWHSKGSCRFESWLDLNFFLMLSSRQLLLIQTLGSSHPHLILKCRDNHHTQISRTFTFLCHQLSSCHVQSTNQNASV